MRFIRRAEADQQRLDALLDGIPVVPVEPRLEDGFMVLLRSAQAACIQSKLCSDMPAMVTCQPL